MSPWQDGELALAFFYYYLYYFLYCLLSPWQDGELALAEFCLKRPRGVVEVGEAFSYSEDNGLYDTVMTVLIS